jgi:hypothetical protein
VGKANASELQGKANGNVAQHGQAQRSENAEHRVTGSGVIQPADGDQGIPEWNEECKTNGEQ